MGYNRGMDHQSAADHCWTLAIQSALVFVPGSLVAATVALLIGNDSILYHFVWVSIGALPIAGIARWLNYRGDTKRPPDQP